MFNVKRTYPAPSSLTKSTYNTEEIVKALERMFHGKCYLCEQDRLQDAEIEHFVPHKGHVHTDLLDCTKDINFIKKIIFKMPSASNDDVSIEAIRANQNATIDNTVNLLRECYNSRNTGLRGVSRVSLIEIMFFYYGNFIQALGILRNKSSGKTKKKEAEETIEAMLAVEHPFSIFWRWQYLREDFLIENYPHLRIGF